MKLIKSLTLVFMLIGVHSTLDAKPMSLDSNIYYSELPPAIADSQWYSAMYGEIMSDTREVVVSLNYDFRNYSNIAYRFGIGFSQNLLALLGVTYLIGHSEIHPEIGGDISINMTGLSSPYGFCSNSRFALMPYLGVRYQPYYPNPFIGNTLLRFNYSPSYDFNHFYHFFSFSIGHNF